MPPLPGTPSRALLTAPPRRRRRHTSVNKNQQTPVLIQIRMQTTELWVPPAADADAACWYFIDNNRAYRGPVSKETLRYLYSTKAITGKTYVFAENLAAEGPRQWTRVHKLPELHEELQRGSRAEPPAGQPPQESSSAPAAASASSSKPFELSLAPAPAPAHVDAPLDVALARDRGAADGDAARPSQHDARRLPSGTPPRRAQTPSPLPPLPPARAPRAHSRALPPPAAGGRRRAAVGAPDRPTGDVGALLLRRRRRRRLHVDLQKEAEASDPSVWRRARRRAGGRGRGRSPCSRRCAGGCGSTRAT